MDRSGGDHAGGTDPPNPRASGAAAPGARSLYTLFAEQARRTPDAPAIDDGDRVLSYQELDRRSAALARRLRVFGVGPDVPVALLVGRTFALAVGILAVLRAGGAYVPLDPAHPHARLAMILGDVDARALVCESDRAAGAPPHPTTILVDEFVARDWTDHHPDDANDADDADAPTPVEAAHLGYIIYTSGSTGRPKGVALPHAALVNVIEWHAAHHLGGAATLQFAAVGFDLCFYELFLAWRTGGVIHLIDEATRRDVGLLGAVIRARGIARAILPVVVLQQLAEAHLDRPEVLASLREVTSSGEQMHLTPPVIRLFEALPECTLHNHYGPSETHVATALALPADRGAWIPYPTIGRAIAESRALVLDEHMNPCPPGVAGEIYLGGACLARGYWGRADLTADRFVPDPISGEPGARLFRSGDLGRVTDDGTLEYLGRGDDQVKIRGVRVELGEVLSVISIHPRIREAIVVAREDTPGDRRLCAYVVTGEPDDPDGSDDIIEGTLALEAELRALLRARLPEAMIPATITRMDALPLTVNGKVDKRALPRPAEPAPRGAAPRRRPESADELAVAAIWQEVLGVTEVGVDDDFYALGGHSLAATRVLVRVRHRFAVEVSFARFAAAPTIAGLVACLAAAPATTEAPIPALPRDRPLPLSLAQERLWFLHRLDPTSPAYACPYAFRLRGPLDVAALEAALEALIRRHEPLRTTFVEVQGRPAQRIADALDLPLERGDLAAIASDDREAELRARLDAAARRPFDLERGPLIRVGLVRLAADEHALWMVLHHIITDGWSMAVLFAELAEGYAAAQRGAAPELAPLPLQFADFAAWQRECLSGHVLDDMIAWWRGALADAPARLDLPTDRPRPPIQSGRGGAVPLTVAAATTAAIRGLARARRVTVSTVLLAAYAALLGRQSGASVIAIGVPIAARDRLEIEPLVGFFISTLPVVVDLRGDPSFAALIDRAEAASQGAFAHAAVPFDRLVQALRPERSLAHTPIVQVGFAPQLAGDRELALAGLAVTPLEIDAGRAVFDLMFYLWEDDDVLTGILEHSADLFDRATIIGVGERLLALLDGVIDDPTRPISRAPILTAGERATRARINAWEGPPARAPLHAAFLAHARATPDALAVAGPDLSLSYAALEARSAALARRLVGAGVRPLIAVCLPRGPRQAIAVLAILRAGAAYLPIDPALPPARIRVLLIDGDADLVLSDRDSRARVDEAGLAYVRVIDVDEPAPAPAIEPRSAPTIELPEIDPDALAYVLYTSGSTGQPKGVMISHAAVWNSIADVQRRAAIGPGDRFLALSALSFDLSVYDLFGPLSAGGALIYPAAAGARDPATWPLAGITVLSTVPQLTELLLESGVDLPPSLRWVMWCGDWIPLSLPDRVRARAPQVGLISLWGATEASIWSTYFEVGAVDPSWRSIPCGTPLRHQTIYVLDDALEPCPDGVQGELFVGGAGLARGYWNDPERSAARFFDHPVTGERLYRSGDLARLGADGSLEFLGRGDAQVKIRGHRVELGEIEATLLLHPGVASAVAGTPDRQRLFVWVVAIAGVTAPTSAELRAFVADRLPAAMVPGAVFVIDAMPLNANGKVDRRALLADAAARLQAIADPAPAPPADHPAGGARNRASARPTIERVLAAIWGEVLEIPRVDPSAVFFELGGHSLLLPRVRAAIQERLGVTLSLIELFEHPTIRALTERIAGDPALAGSKALAGASAGAASEAPIASAARSGAIAVVGVAGRFPGARTIDELWANLIGGVESITFSSPEALRAAGIDPSLIDSPRFVPAYGLMDDALAFDAAFFGYSPQEARLLDPQQRVLLECAFTALEDAALDPARRDLRIGVFAGCDAPYYWLEQVGLPGPPQGVEEFQATFANMPDTLTTRIAHKLGLRGPAVTVLSACSTSLVAIHLACQSLRAGECDAVIAGGAAVGPASHLGHMVDETGVTAPDGHCRPFDADARGTVNSSAVAAVVLRRLEDALADGDAIRAVILGSAVGNDGADRIGFTAPGVRGQVETVRRAHLDAKIDPATITFVEAHGTGTRLGDPIEVRALTQAFRAGTDRRGFCALGSIKGHIGHTSAAAGVTGFIKAVMASERRLIPPTLHFRSPNPEAGLDDGPFFVPATPIAWAPPGPRRAGVSAFGIGGTNAHVILEEAPPARATEPSPPWQALPLSARSDRALGQRLTLLGERLAADPALDLGDVAHTLQRRPALAPARALVIARDRDDAITTLTGAQEARIVRGRARRSPPRLAFVFPGAATQHAGMIRELAPRFACVREILDRCIDSFAEALGVDLRPVIFPEPGGEAAAASALKVPSINMPVIFTIEVALAGLLQHLGLRPDAVIGHSLGEYAAAQVAGVMSLTDAARMVGARSRLSDAFPPGAMLSVRVSEAAILPRLGPELSIAAINSGDACIIAGPIAATEALARALADDGIDSKLLPVAGAGHSTLVEPFVPALIDYVRAIELQRPTIPMISSATGTWIDAEAATAEHWGWHLRRAVRFADAITTLLADPELVVIEVGPGGHLSGLIRRSPAAGPDRLVVPAMVDPRSGRGEFEALLAAIGGLWCAGVDVEWSALHEGAPRRVVPLPSYPFARVRHVAPGSALRRVSAPIVDLPADADDQDGEDDEDALTDAEAIVDPLTRAVAAIWARCLGLRRVRPGDNFFDLGGTSLIAMQIRGQLEERLRLRAGAHALVESPVLADLVAELRRDLDPAIAAALADADAEAAAAGPATPASTSADAEPSASDPPAPDLVVRLRAPQPGSNAAPIFFIQPIGGTVYTYLPLTRRLAYPGPLLGLRPLGLEPGEPVLRDIHAIVDATIAAITRAQPEGALIVAGHSAGGILAYAVAARLEAAGRPVRVWMIDAGSLAAIADEAVESADDLRRILAPFAATAAAAIDALSAAIADKSPLGAVILGTWAALRQITPAPIDAPVLYIAAAEQRDPRDARAGAEWMDHARGPFSYHRSPGDHFTMMEEPAVAALARLLDRALE